MVRLLRTNAAVVAIEQSGRAVVAVRSQGGGGWRDITIMVAVSNGSS